MRSRVFRRTALAFVVALLADAAPEGPLAAGIDAGRFYKAYMDTETLAERRELCRELDPAGAAPYLLIFCQGLDAIDAGSDSLAARLMQESLRQQPDFVLGCVAFGDAYMEQRKWRVALRWYGEGRRIAPDRLDPNYGAGQAWLALGETEGAPAYEKALEAFQVMTRIDPSSADGWSNVGMALAMLGRYDDAEASYRKALSLAPGEPQIYEALGSVASRRGDDAAAEEAWRKALKIDPADAPAAVELASLCGRQGRLADAGVVLQAGVEASHVGPEAGRLRRDLALVKLLQQEDAQAMSLLEEAVVLRPDARTLAALGHARMLAGRSMEALAVFADAAQKDSAAVAPFVRAWRAELTPLLGAADAGGSAGSQLIGGILARSPAAEGPKGRDATAALVRLLLPDWQIPQGRLDVAPAENGTGYDTPPTPAYRALASYPETAVGIEGTVYVRVQIDAQGVVKDAKVSRGGGNPALEWAAVDAAKRWRFHPALRNGIPVASEVEIPFRFSGGSR